MQLICRETTFTGPPLPLPFNSLLIELYHFRQAPKSEFTQGRHKAVFRTACVTAMTPEYPHEFPLTCGSTQVQNPDVVRMNHYWGLRANGFEPVKPEDWSTLQKDYSIKVSAGLDLQAHRTIQVVVVGVVCSMTMMFLYPHEISLTFGFTQVRSYQRCVD